MSRKFIFVPERYPLTVAQLHTEDYYARPPLLMQERGWEVQIWSFFERPDEPEQEVLSNLPVRRFRSWRLLRKELESLRPELVHVMAATKNNLMLAGTVPNMVLTGQNLLLSSNLIKREIQKYLRKRFDRIICLTPHELGWHASFMAKGKLVRIPMSIDVQFFSQKEDKNEARRIFGIPQDAYVVLYVGNFREVKQPDKMLQGFAAFYHQRHDKSFFLVVGKNLCGDLLKRKIESLVNLHRLEECVKFTGYLLPEEVKKAISASDCQINFSTWEGQNLAIYEGFCQGLPASLPRLEVFTSVFPDCLYHETPEELAENLHQLASDPHLYRKQSEIHSEMVKHYNYKICEEQLLDLYSELVGPL